MRRPTELDLMRLLHGELPPEQARALRARLLSEPDLAAAYRRLERSWSALELPPPIPVPVGFSTRLMSRLRQSAGSAAPSRLSWAAAPTWVRAAAATALVTGVALGAGVGSLGALPHAGSTGNATAELDLPEAAIEIDSNLADSYWEAVESATSSGAAQQEDGPREAQP